MNIDKSSNFKTYDPYKVAESISLLPEQILEIISESKKIKIPKDYKNVGKIIVNGMGGSNLGAWILREVFMDTIKVPVSILPGYQVPARVNKDTLYILSSYSGTTEEVLSVYKEIKKRKAKILILSAGGKLGKLMKKDNIPGLIFNPKQNPSGQPRLGIGYSIFGMMELFSKTGLIKINKQEVREIIDLLTKNNSKLSPEIHSSKNSAKKLALELKGQIPVLVGAEFLTGNLHTLRNQICETCKNFATYLELPDLNHFAMEGLAHPTKNKKGLSFLFFDSDLYTKRVQERSALTKKVIKNNDIEVHIHKLKAKTKLEQAFEMLHLGSWLTYYLGMLNDVNPVEIPYVDWFKNELSKKPFKQ